jgi:hypothetical protein
MAPLFSVPLLQKSFAGNGFHGARRWYTPRSRTEFRFFRINNMFFIVFQFFFTLPAFQLPICNQAELVAAAPSHPDSTADGR